MKPTPAPFTMRQIGEHRTLVTFPNGRKVWRPRFRRNRSFWGALRRRATWGAVLAAFGAGAALAWFLLAVVVPLIDGPALGR